MGTLLLSLITLLCLAAVTDFGEYENKNVKWQINLQQSNKQALQDNVFQFQNLCWIKIKFSMG
jgi:hypothetical protein